MTDRPGILAQGCWLPAQEAPCENFQSHTPSLRATPLKEGTFGYKDRREIHSREGGWRDATGVVAPRQLFSDA